MAEFLTRKGVSARLEDIIKNADEELILISPFIKIDKHTKELLEKKDGIEIHVVYGKKKELHREESRWLEKTDSIRMSFHKDLHAKCYLNESQAILTSMNLYDFSEENNIEMGISVSREEDRQLYDEIRKEAVGIIDRSEKIRRPGWTRMAAKTVIGGIKELTKEPSSPGRQPGTPKRAAAPRRKQPRPSNSPGRQPETPKRGFCIRCKADDLPANPDRPYCNRCYASWRRYENKDYEEKYCHTCGNEYASTLLKPVCFACYKKYKDVFTFAVS